ncbi:hypothetical protein A7982_12199 [Minicystis rosea]|nr:hypothetical protein A7982_12199 [Minicystis rosea]
MEQAQTWKGKTATDRPAHTLESLAALDVDALAPVYAAGTVPASIAALDGHPRGRMLSVRRLDHGGIGNALRAFSGAAAFPWGGKSFAAESASAGTGINRVHLFGRHQLFPFHTRMANSVIDGRSAILLDYDLPDNPYLIRQIHDEVREVSPGLFLGPAMWKGKDGPTFVLWFALDTGAQAKPIGSRGRP